MSRESMPVEFRLATRFFYSDDLKEFTFCLKPLHLQQIKISEFGLVNIAFSKNQRNQLVNCLGLNSLRLAYMILN